MLVDKTRAMLAVTGTTLTPEPVTDKPIEVLVAPIITNLGTNCIIVTRILKV